MLRFFLIALLLFIQGGSSSPLSRATIAAPKTNSEDYLLPTDLRPDHYTIELEPDFENDVFSGSVSIEFTVISATRNFYFHRKELEIDSSSFILLSNSGLPTTTVGGYTCVTDDREFCVITFADELIQGASYTLTIGKFTGILNLDNAGFYLAKYTDEEGNEV